MVEEFENFLEKKKINSKTFKENDPAKWKKWAEAFSQQHPASFVAQQLYLINAIRRTYPLSEKEEASNEQKAVAKAKPKFIRKPKPSNK